MKVYAIFSSSKGSKDLLRVVSTAEEAIEQTKFFKNYEMNSKINYTAYASNNGGWFGRMEPYCKNGEIL